MKIVTDTAQFIGGWFIGNFEPSLLKTENFEVAIKEYKKGDYEISHFHKLSKEFTVILVGTVKMNEIEYKHGDIVVVNEYEKTNFECLEDCITVVIRNKSIKGDKYD